MRQKRYKGKRHLFQVRVLPVLALFAVFTLMFGVTAFSSGEGDKFIKFADSEWKIKESDTQTWYTNEDEVTFTLDLSEDFSAHEKSGNVPEEEPAPFTVNAVHGDTELTVTEPKPSGPDFKGEYEVSVTLQEGDGDANITITFPKETWANPDEEDWSATFTIKKDQTKPAPEFKINDSKTLKDKYNEEVKLTFSSEEEVKLYINDEAKGKWRTEGTITLKDDGIYEAYVKDRAGNKSDTISFAIARWEPVLIVKTDKEEIANGAVITPGNLEFKVDSPLPITDYKIKVTKDGEPVEGISTNKRWKTVTWSKNFTEDGKYEAEVSIDVWKHSYTFNFDFTIDGTGPKIKINDVKNNGTYNEPQEVTIEITDPNGYELISGPTAKRTDLNGKTKTYGKFTKDKDIFKQTFDEDGIYEIIVAAEDKLGNKTEETRTFIIDTSAPELNTDVKNNNHYNIDKFDLNVKDYTLDQVNAVLTYEENEEQKEQPLTFTKNGTQAVAEVVLPKKNGKTREGEYQIKWEATDKFDNQNSGTINFTIDNTDPVLTLKANGESVTKKYYNKDQTINITVDDNYEQVNTKLIVKLDGKKEKDIKTTTTGPIDFELTKEGHYEISLEATDKAGNKAEPINLSFWIDKQAPELNQNKLRANGHYSSAEVDFTVFDLTLKTAALHYQLNGGEATEIPLKSDSRQNANATVLIGKDACGQEPDQDKTYLCEEGHYTVTLTASDHAKNGTSELILPLTVDYTAPKIALTGIADGAYIQTGTLNIAIEDNFHIENITVEVNGEQVKTAAFNGEDLNPTWSDNLYFNTEDHKTADGQYNVKVTAIDRAGNEHAKELSFTVDATKPDIAIIDVNDNTYYAEGQTVTILIEEENFDPELVNITAVKEGNNENLPFGEKWTRGEDGRWAISQHFADDGKYTITVNASDKAGNKADKQSVIFTIDKIKPVITVDGVENGQNYKSAKATITVTDANIDLEQTELTVTKGGEPYNIGSLQLEEGSTTKAALTYNFTEEGAYTIRVKTTDKAGWTTEHEDISFIIDSTAPVITIDGPEDGAYYNETTTVNISVVEHNYQTNTIDIEVTKNGEPYKDFPYELWKNSAKESKLSYGFIEDGRYTVKVTAIDKAGNGPVTSKVTFTVDKTTPAIDISGVENGEHYNVTKIVTMTIADTNLDVNKVTVTRNGQSYNAGTFDVKGGKATLVHGFSTEGEYDILIEATDKAGNTADRTINFTIDKTAPVITPYMGAENRVIQDGEYINKMFTPRFALDVKEDKIVSVIMNGNDVTGAVPAITADGEYEFTVVARDKAGNRSEISFSFILDVTMPKLDISGVVDGYFNEAVVPVIKYSDENLDEKNTYVTLNGKPYKSGTKIEYEQDYVLKAHIADLAGNVTSRTIVFTIDKTAPTIRFMEPISEQYFNDAIIPELIIEDMSSYNIISMTLNGEPYEVGQKITTEGKHVLYFEVKDAAGNIKQLSVEFIIDLTPPKILYEGAEKDGVYYDPVSVKLSLDNPQDRFQRILVNGKLFDGEVTERNGEKYIRIPALAIGEYTIEAHAIDEAGNESELILPFKIEEKSLFMKITENKALFAGSIAGILMLLAAIGALIYRQIRQKQKQQEIQEDYYN